MKVLYIADPGIVGGATQSLIDVVTSMKDRGISCIVVTSNWSELNNLLEGSGIKTIVDGHYPVMIPKAIEKWKNPLRFVKYYTLHMLTKRKAVRKIEAQVDMNTVDIIHTNSARNDIGCLLCKNYNIPHIMHIREFGTLDFDCWILKNNYYSYLNNYTTEFIAISKAVSKYWISQGIDKSKVKVIYNGVNDLTIEPHNWINEKNKSLLTVIVGGVCEAKGQLQVVEAISKLPRDIADSMHLDIWGWDDKLYKEKIDRYIINCHLEEIVEFKGSSKSINSILHNYEVGFVCSRSEGFGRVTAEYMHANLAIIASNTGANRELIGENDRGLLYQFGNTTDLAEKIKDIYINRKYAENVAKNGYKYAKHNYTKSINSNNIYKVYLKCMCKRNLGK